MRRRSIRRAALKLFVERGFRQTTMDMVAKKARLSKGLLYFYFSSKDQILTEIIRENFDELLSLLEERLKGEKNALKLLEKFILTEVLFYSRKRDLSRFLYSLLVGYELEDIKRGYRDVFLDMHKREKEFLVRILSMGIEEGRFEERDLDLLMHFISGPLHSLILFRREPLRDPRDTAKELTSLFLNGVLRKGR